MNVNRISLNYVQLVQPNNKIYSPILSRKGLEFFRLSETLPCLPTVCPKIRAKSIFEEAGRIL